MSHGCKGCGYITHIQLSLIYFISRVLAALNIEKAFDCGLAIRGVENVQRRGACERVRWLSDSPAPCHRNDTSRLTQHNLHPVTHTNYLLQLRNPSGIWRLCTARLSLARSTQTSLNLLQPQGKAKGKMSPEPTDPDDSSQHSAADPASPADSLI